MLLSVKQQTTRTVIRGAGMDLDETNYVADWRKRYDKFNANSVHQLTIETTLKFVEPEQRKKLNQGLIDKQKYYATLDQCFDFLLSFFVMKVGYRDSEVSKDLIWKHQDASLINLLYSENPYVKTEVERLCEEYLLSSEDNISYMDWLILDVLTYLELKAFVSEMHKKNTGILGSLAGALTKNYQFNFVASRAMGSVTQAAVYFIFPLIIVVNYLLVGGGSLKMWIAAFFGFHLLSYLVFFPNKIIQYNRERRLTEAMLRVYSDLESSVISMSALKFHLDEGVKEGVIYNHSVFAILNNRNRNTERDWFSPFRYII